MKIVAVREENFDFSNNRQKELQQDFNGQNFETELVN